MPILHGMFGTPEYAAWCLMIRRCERSAHPKFKHYGARGISVHPAWRQSFSAFLASVGPRPSSRHSLDRFPDKDGNYEPGNVRWATAIEQNRNKRSNHLLTVDGVTATISEWAERTGLLKQTIRMRLQRGWSASRAVTEPPTQ